LEIKNINKNNKFNSIQKMIVEEIIKRVRRKTFGNRVEDIVIGLNYTYVKLTQGCGVAYTLKEARHCFVSDSGDFCNKTPTELINFIRSHHPLKLCIGMATINALIEVEEYEIGDILKFLDISSEDIVGMVGYFSPLIERLKCIVKELYVFEREKIDNVYPDWAVYELLPKCSVVFITGVAVMNKTIHTLLKLAESAREICIVGATTPLIPEVFKKYGVTLLGGIRIVDCERLRNIIKEGGGARNFGNTVEKIVVRIK